VTPGTYKTRDGTTAVVLVTNAPGGYPLVGYVEPANSTYILPTMWTAAGTFYPLQHPDEHAHDIMPTTTWNLGGKL
jgi:hypothetical protein